MATIRDVAARAGVSVAAASYALNGGGRLSGPTRARIQKIAKQLGYRPSSVALALRGTRAKVMGIFMDGVGGPFFSDIMEGAHDVLRGAGFGILAVTLDAGGRETASRMAHDSMISGALILNPGVAGRDLLEDMARRIPLVLFDSRFSVPGCPRFGIQNREGMAALMEHLLSHGFRDFAYLDGDPRSNDAIERKRVFKAALKRAGLALEPERLLQGSFKVQPAEAAMGAFLDRGLRTRVVVAANDQMALGAMRAILARGFRIPDDIAVTGFDNIEASTWTHPALTTVGYDREGLGRLMARSLLERLEGWETSAAPSAGSADDVVSIPASLILRQSCGTEGLPPQP
jgi:LacI family transcriptional regulator